MTNSVPFRDEKEFEKIREISIGGYLPSVTDDPHISLVPGLDHLIANCWRMDPTKRPTGKDCREWMNQMVRNAGIDCSSTTYVLSHSRKLFPAQ